jgi:hypothetical protein
VCQSVSQSVGEKCKAPGRGHLWCEMMTLACGSQSTPASPTAAAARRTSSHPHPQTRPHASSSGGGGEGATRHQRARRPLWHGTYTHHNFWGGVRTLRQKRRQRERRPTRVPPPGWPVETCYVCARALLPLCVRSGRQGKSEKALVVSKQVLRAWLAALVAFDSSPAPCCCN